MGLSRQLAHDAIKPRLTFKADARTIGERKITVFKLRIVGEAAEIAEHAGIGLSPTKTEAAGDRQRHLVAAVREQEAARPLMAGERLERAGILHDAIGLRRIDLNDVVALRL